MRRAKTGPCQTDVLQKGREKKRGTPTWFLFRRAKVHQPTSKHVGLDFAHRSASHSKISHAPRVWVSRKGVVYRW